VTITISAETAVHGASQPGATGTRWKPAMLRLLAPIALKAAFASMLALNGIAAAAQTWPSKPIHILVAAGAGSSPDVFARVLGERLTHALGQAVIVEARPGGNGSIAARAVATAEPDGYTLLFSGNSALIVNPLMTRNLPYKEADLVPVAPVCLVPLAVAVSNASDVKSIQELLASAKESETFFATPGAASLSRLIGESFNERAGTKLRNIPYPTSGPAQTDVIGGRVPVLIDGLGGIVPHAKAGRLRLLAVSTPARFPDYPDTPSISEAVPGLSVPGINSLMAPAGTPEPVLDLLNRKINQILQDPVVEQRFLAMGGQAAPGSRAALAETFRQQRIDFQRLIESANIQATQ